MDIHVITAHSVDLVLRVVDGVVIVVPPVVKPAAVPPEEELVQYQRSHSAAGTRYAEEEDGSRHRIIRGLS